jgi:16S rRNA (cytosine1402-N4)-methyltransferase
VVESGKSLEEQTNDSIFHVPVLSERILHWLKPHAGRIYVDCTLGLGGLAAKILDHSSPDGILIGIDHDERAISVSRQNLARFGDRARLVRGDFAALGQHLDAFGVTWVDGIVFDLGVSSAQLADVTRGFSFQLDGPLDMRMDRTAEPTAADLVNGLSERELADLIFHYGEERFARRIARGIVGARNSAPLLTTQQLVAAIREAVPGSYRYGRLHFATRTFQALRIAVNRELEVLEPALKAAVNALVPGGRVCVISFHSLEDRIAKRTFKQFALAHPSVLRILTKRPEIASEGERRENPRARSAKLRVAERRVS